MGITALYVYLLTVGAVAYVSGSDPIIPATEPPHGLVDPTRRFFDVIKKLLCWDDACKDFESPATEQSYETTISADYEPQHPDAEVVNATDSYPKLCDSLVNLVREMEKADPTATRMKATAFLKMIFYTMSFKAAEDERCHPAVKMLDIIILAAHKVRLEYMSNDEDLCTFVEIPIGEERAGYTPTAPPKTEKPKAYPTQTPQPESSSVAPVTEESSKSPCSEEITTTQVPCSKKPEVTTETAKPTTQMTEAYPTQTPKPESSSVALVTEESSKPPCPEETTTTQVPCARDPDKQKVTTETAKPTTVKPAVPCPDNATETTKKPCLEKTTVGYTTTEETIAEQGDDPVSPPFTGSIRGIPGEHYPNYTDIPITSFSCSDKKFVPGFYADLETGCQVFHVCYEHRRESFLCPVGTIFNQPILACDYWYSTNCSLAPSYYDVNAKTEEISKEEMEMTIELISTIYEKQEHVSITSETKEHKSVTEALDDIVKFLPVKVIVREEGPSEPKKPVTPEKPKEETIPPKKHEGGESPEKPKEKDTIPSKKTETLDVEDVASKIFDQMLKSVTKSISKTRGGIEKIPEPAMPDKFPMIKTKTKQVAKAKLAVPIASKAKFATKAKLAIPIAAKTKLAAAVPLIKTAAAVPLVTKAKLAVPFAAKGKLAAAAVPAKVLASKVAVPVAAKGKIVAAIPVAKAAAVKAAGPLSVKKLIATMPKVAVKASVPVIKGKIFASSMPLAKSAVFKSTIPVSKAKLAPILKAKTLKSPVVKGKLVALPLAKSKLAGSVPLKAKLMKSAAISPLTKKALAVGYIKLLKAKKLAMMG